MEIMERAAQLEASGRSVVHMEVGEPDFAVCREISTAGAEAIARGDTKYTSATGLPELRRTISSYYGRLGVDIDPERIVVTSGGSGGLLLLAAALLNPSARNLPEPTQYCKDTGDYSGGHPPAVTKQGKILPPSPISARRAKNPKMFYLLGSAWAPVVPYEP